MVSRALGLAAVLLLMCGGLAGQVAAQENLDAGKSPSQLFAGNCNACHKSPRGLLKTVAAGSLPGFLRQHYTTGPEMAGVLSSYLVANGAGDVRAPARGGRGAKSDAKSDAVTSDPSEQAPRAKRHGKRSARPKAATDAKPGAEPAEAPKPGSAVHASEAPKSEAPESAPTTTQSIPASSGGSDAATPSR